MRTIKFRGKDIETGKWVYGFYVRLEDTFRKPIEGKERITNRIYTGSADSCVGPTTGYDFSGDWYEVDPDTIGQFTGLFDKNEAEIYEGDILRSCFNDTEEPLVFEVIFDYGEFKRRYNKVTTCICPTHLFWEVIGNVHDNPELLKGGAK